MSILNYVGVLYSRILLVLLLSFVLAVFIMSGFSLLSLKFLIIIFHRAFHRRVMFWVSHRRWIITVSLEILFLNEFLIDFSYLEYAKLYTMLYRFVYNFAINIVILFCIILQFSFTIIYFFLSLLSRVFLYSQLI